MSIRTWIREFQCFSAELIRDDSGRPSLSKLNLGVGVAIGGFVVVKMTILGQLTEAIFALYLTFCSGHTLLNKFLDNKAGKAGT